MKKLFKSKNGYVALITVLIVGAVSLTIATSLILLTIGSSRSSSTIEQNAKAENVSSSCANEVLLIIKRNNSFVGTGSMSFDIGSCNYSVLDTGFENREVQITSTSNNITMKEKITIDQINPRINITYWANVDSF